MYRFHFGAAVAVILVAGGCGGSGHVVQKPFTPLPGVESGPDSGSWGDGASTPKGMQIGCIDGRKLAVLITVHNRMKETVTLLRGEGNEKYARIIDPVAVRVSLRPPPPSGDVMQPGLRSWTSKSSSPADIPSGRDAYVQTNFLMRNCASLRPIEPVTANRSLTLTYRTKGGKGSQAIAVPATARVSLTRGPAHPTVPINQVG